MLPIFRFGLILHFSNEFLIRSPRKYFFFSCQIWQQQKKYPWAKLGTWLIFYDFLFFIFIFIDLQIRAPFGIWFLLNPLLYICVCMWTIKGFSSSSNCIYIDRMTMNFACIFMMCTLHFIPSEVHHKWFIINNRTWSATSFNRRVEV